MPDSARPRIIEQAKLAARTGGFDAGNTDNQIPAEVQTQLAKLPAPARVAAIEKYQAQQVQIGQAIKSDVQAGITKAVQSTLYIALAFCIASIFVGFGVPNIDPMIHDKPSKPQKKPN